LPISIDYYGSGVVIVPFRAHLRAYLGAGDLPLWNPGPGIGQPLAAQGEGGPYSPLALLRALLPPTWANGVTIGVFMLSAIAMRMFLRLLGASPASSTFGGAAWVLSGALMLHIARDNIADQLSLIPVPFLAAAWSIVSRRPAAYALFAVVVGLYTVAGFLQIGVNALIVLVSFIVVLSYLQARTTAGRVRTAVVALIFLALGLALASPYTLPIVEAIGVSYNKNSPYLAFIPMPSANIIALFFPLLFGQMLQGWLRGSYPDVVDWNNLFAYGGTSLLILTTFGLASLKRQRFEQKVIFLFFVGVTLALLGRYVSFPPFSGMSFLPILNQQSPKHTNGVTVFCLVVAASIATGWLRSVDRRRAALYIVALFVMVASSVLTLIGRRGGLDAVDVPTAILYVSMTLVISLIVLIGLWNARSARTDADAVTLAAAVTIGELSIYLPLGNGDPVVVGLRMVVFALIVLSGVFAIRRATILAGASSVLAFAVYTGLVIVPGTGLPEQVDVERPPQYMTWLHDAAGDEYRVFGIQPDYAAISNIQDIEAVGPLATNEYMRFVGLISSPTTFDFVRAGSTFSLVHPVFGTPLYDLAQDYPRARPILDWFAVKYVVFSHRVYRPDTSEEPSSLLSRVADLNVVYNDDDVTIVESSRVATKAIFAPSARPVASPDEAIGLLRVAPDDIRGPVLVESAPAALSKIATATTREQIPVPLTEYRPNRLQATFKADSPGVFVVKDSYFPGWQATLDGEPTEVVRVNGMVRGIIVPTRGRHDVVMRYQPTSFTAGLAVAAATLLVLAVVVACDLVRLRAVIRRQVLAAS
jgi:hypothetical protein